MCKLTALQCSLSALLRILLSEFSAEPESLTYISAMTGSFPMFVLFFSLIRAQHKGGGKDLHPSCTTVTWPYPVSTPGLRGTL